MKKNLLFCQVSLCLLTLAFAANAATLLPPAAADQQPTRLMTLPAPTTPIERKPVSFAWALDPAAALETVAPHVAESREYWFVAEAGELARGIDVQTTAPGVVIRLSPAEGGAAIDPAAVRLSKAGRVVADPLAFAQRHDAATMRAAGMDVPDGSAVVRIAAGQGAGTFRLQVAQASGRTLVHVFEPDSPYVLRAQAERSSVLAGDVLEVAAVLQRGRAKLGGGATEGELVAPSGARFPLTFTDGVARFAVPVDADPGEGLWEVQMYAATVDGGVGVQREARTAVQVTRPTARLGGAYTFDAAAVAVRMPLQVASPGRYELRGTLYATGPDGVARPVAQAHSANWFGAGHRELTLGFGRANVPAGYGAPFEVRDLELNDQSRMGRLETRAVALREAGPRRPAPVRNRIAER
jgi:hypothetical protein